VDQNTEFERDVMDMTLIFNENEDTDGMSASDVLVSHLNSDNDILGASDVLMSQNIEENNDCDYDQANRQIKDLQELVKYPMDSDETFLYSIYYQDATESTSQNKEKRTRRRPAILATMFINNFM
jgi:hypothetical protein